MLFLGGRDALISSLGRIHRHHGGRFGPPPRDAVDAASRTDVWCRAASTGSHRPRQGPADVTRVSTAIGEVTSSLPATAPGACTNAAASASASSNRIGGVSTTHVTHRLPLPPARNIEIRLCRPYADGVRRRCRMRLSAPPASTVARSQRPSHGPSQRARPRPRRPSAKKKGRALSRPARSTRCESA